MQGGAHALAAFAHRLVGEADHGEGRHAGPDLHLHVHFLAIDALEGDGLDPRYHELRGPMQPATPS